MSVEQEAFGRTIQLYLVDGTPNGLRMASIHGWTGSLMVATQSTFDRLLARKECMRTGVYILFGQDPDDPLKNRAYIGEADCVRDRIDTSAKDHDFWDTAVVITTSDDAFNKGHIRYLEARLIEMTKQAGRVSLDNTSEPQPERRKLHEADRANMEGFLANLKVILPVVGLDLLKPVPVIEKETLPKPLKEQSTEETAQTVLFETRHKSGVKAYAADINGDFVVLKESHALKDTGYATNDYGHLKKDLIDLGILVPSADGKTFVFTQSYGFRSPSAACAVVLDRNANGRTRWYVVGTDLNYHEWQELKAQNADKMAA